MRKSSPVFHMPSAPVSEGSKEFHFTGRVPEPSPMRYRHEGVSMGGSVTIDEYAYLFTDPTKIAGALEALSTLDEH